jgi:hypothetical protein
MYIWEGLETVCWEWRELWNYLTYKNGRVEFYTGIFTLGIEASHMHKNYGLHKALK